MMISIRMPNDIVRLRIDSYTKGTLRWKSATVLSGHCTYHEERLSGSAGFLPPH